MKKVKEREIDEDSNTGACNSGNCNSGNYNTGDYNTGSFNIGNFNSGSLNSGNCNSGNSNTGDHNKGFHNNGNYNTGDSNAGEFNAGNCNSGNHNTGSRNNGDCNSGCWNSCDDSSGYFNTKTHEEMMFFNKPYVKKLEGTTLPRFLYFSLLEWVPKNEMSSQELKGLQECQEGYFKVLEYQEAFQKSWEKRGPEEQRQLEKIPNFDWKIFSEISGITPP